MARPVRTDENLAEIGLEESIETMDVIEAIYSRRSIRSYKSDSVPKELLEEIIDISRWSPSASNTQPWELAVMGGDTMKKFADRLVEKVKAEWDTTNLKFKTVNPDIPYPDMSEPYISRAKAVRNSIDRHQFPPGTEGLEEKRANYLLYGGRLYGAPNAIIIYTEKSMCPKAILDLGMIIQTIALVAHAKGLGTCLMTMPVGWPEIARDILNIPDSKLLALGIAIGYPIPEAPVNNFERVREETGAFTKWHGI